MRKLGGKICFLGIFLTLAFASGATAQWNPLNPVTGFQKQADSVDFAMHSGTLRIQVCSDAIIRVVYSATSSFPDTPQYAVIKTAWPATQWTLQSSDKDVTIATSLVKVTVTRADGTIRFSDATGKKLFEDFDRSLTPVEVNGEKTYHAEMFSNLWDSTEAFYGLGQHQAGVWNYHGEDVELSQDNTNISVPMFLSSKGYGIFWNNPSRSRFDNRFLHALYLSSEVADTVDYYFLYGPEFDKIIASYRELTGAAPLFGKWAYGFWQCKNKYSSQEEILSVAHKYRELHIPVDNIVQDWFWWNKMGEPVFNKNYPDPKGMISDLHEHHFHIMFSFWPFFEPGTSVYDDMDKRGYFIARTQVAGFHPKGIALYDAFNPAARKYYWNLMDEGLFQNRRRRLVAGYGRARNRGARNKHSGDQQSCNRQRCALREFVSTDDDHRRLRRPAQRIRSKARLYLVALRIRRNPTQRRHRVVRRCRIRLAQLQTPNSRRPELRTFRHPLLDHRYWRLHHRQSRRPSLSRAFRSLVRVRNLLPHLPPSRHTHD